MTRTLDDLPLDFILRTPYLRSRALLGSVKEKVGRSWVSSIRSIGGFWMATCQWEGTRAEMLDLFMEGMMREIDMLSGGRVVWQGFLAEETLTLDGVTYVRKWEETANATKCIYSHIGDNLFANGSAESGAWAGYNTPSLIEQSTAWVSDGTYSCHMTADAENDGAIIEAGITIGANKGYEARVTTNLVSGSWKLEIYREDNDDTLGSASESTAGQRVMRASISDTNTYAGTVGVRLYCTTAAGEIYGDGGVFQESPTRAETSWYDDAASQAEYGRMEEILLEAGMADEAANARAATELAEHTWPRTLPPDEFMVSPMGEQESQSLELVFYGRVFTLQNKHAAQTGTDQASDHVTTLVGEAEFVTAGVIQANTMDYKIDERAPLRAWEVLKLIARAGDTNGGRWNIGVYADGVLDYEKADTAANYHYRRGRLLDRAGAPVDPWEALPGLAAIDDLPVGPGTISSNPADNPAMVYIEEVEFDAGDWLNGGSGLRLRRETDR